MLISNNSHLLVRLPAQPDTDICSDDLHEQAIIKARAAFSQLPKSHAVFQECIKDKRTVTEIVTSTLQVVDVFHRK